MIRSRARTTRLAMLAAAASIALAPAARAEVPSNEDLVCRADRPQMDKYAYLRALSLDLRGTIPTVAEIDALDASPDVPGSLVDTWLASDEFIAQAVRRHRELLWNNIKNVPLLNYQAFLGTTPEYVFWRGQPARLYRGKDVPCDDVPATITNGVIQYRVDADGWKREGWVEVEPYWAPGTKVKVCAFDAQDRLVSSSGTTCGTNAAFADPECGCGPNLNWCAAYDHQQQMLAALGKDVELRIADLVRGDRPYVELFTARTAYVNGPVVHFLRHMTGIPATAGFEPLPIAKNQLPDIPFTQTEFLPVELGPEHAGVLTSPVYLLRFQTNRARANRFFDSFLCQPYQPPPGGLPSPDDACSSEPDLQARCGCKFCHSLLEPAAAHWGRWGEAGAAFLNPQRYPMERADCVECATTGRQCSQDCRDHYVVRATSDKEKPYLGTLRAFYFRREEHKRNVDLGPRYLALGAIVDDRFPGCTSRHAAEWLLGRTLNDDEQHWTSTLAAEFVQSGYSYRQLVKAIVTSEPYRRAR